MEEEDNLTRQADEIEALTAIYGDEWCVVDESYRIYCIAVSNQEEKQLSLKICLQVLLPSEYPSIAPPEYQLNAPWLKDAERQEVNQGLEQVCSDNSGESVLYLLVEHLREHLVNRTQKALHATPGDAFEDEESLLSSEIESKVIFSSSADVVDCEIPPILHGEPISDRRSTFQAHLAAPISTVQQVAQVRRKLLENRKIANACHNVQAYRIYCEDRGIFLQDCDNDGEAAAGPRLLHLMEILDVRNVVVIVTRWFGGILLGPDRFKHINNAARNVLEEHGFIHKDEHGPKSKKGKHKTK